MKVAIVGSRTCTHLDREKVVRFIESLPPGTIVISGACPSGPDLWAENHAKKCGLELRLFPVRTIDIPFGKDGSRHEYAIRAHERNERIANECDILVAFWDGSSRGTKNCYEHAERMGKEVYIVGPNDLVPSVNK